MAAANQTHNKSLSSAAAAAALRARPHTPIDVGAVETKRTQRRSASVSSHSSAARSSSANNGTSRGRGLERKQSSGSMTERTFRTPSPSPHRAPARPVQQQPPVPQIPANHRKSHSVGMQTFRTASQKMKTETPSYYGSSQGDPGNVRTSDNAMRHRASASFDQADPYDRPESRASSINYSYPTKYRPQSPPASPTTRHAPIMEEPRTHIPISPPRSSRTSAASSVGSKPEPALVYDPNSRRMVPAPQPSNVEYEIREVANRQPKKKRNQDDELARSGSHLAKGTMSRARGTAVANDQRSAPPIEQAQAEVSRQQQQDLSEHEQVQQETRRPHQKQSQEYHLPETTHVYPQASSPPERLASPPPVRALTKKPSMVREDPEGEEDVPEIITPLSQRVMDAVESAPSLEQSRNIDEDSDDEVQQYPVPGTQDAAQVQTPLQTTMTTPPENKAVAQLARESTTSKRAVSISPDRRARFGPSVSEQLSVRHQPLPRSASPIKSALKRSGTPSRDVSPSENGSDVYAGAVGNTSDPVAARKKGVRVSFDERSNVVMGESTGDSPASSSPASSKRPWYSSIGRSKKRDLNFEDDEIMKPRPALPSFGSVREKKTREIEERPLVRPSEGARSPEQSPMKTRSDSPDIPTYRTAEEQAQLEAPSDQVIGSVLAQDHESRNEANTSRFREPLPPVVTSVDSNGYHMDTTTDESDNDLFDQDHSPQGYSTVQTTQASQHDDPVADRDVARTVEDKVLVGPDMAARVGEAPAQPVPAIAVILPSPMADEATPKSPGGQSQQYFDVPGGFPDESAGLAKDTHPGSVLEPEAEVQPSQVASLPKTTLVTAGLAGQTQPDPEESSDESIYSDAYEDISDVEGGFQSIDAVVDSPISASFPSRVSGSPKIKPTEAAQTSTKADAPPSHTATSVPTEQTDPAGSDDWSQAESFWRSLTAEKRQQLAREVLEDEGAEGDREEIKTPVRRNSSRRKSQEQKKEALEAATRSVAAKEAHVDQERTYMIQPGSKSKHEIPSTSDDVHMRKSLRGAQPKQSGPPAAAKGSLRKYMRDAPEPRAAPVTSTTDRTRNERPSTSSAGLPSQKSSGPASTGTGLIDTKAASAALAKQMMPKLSRRGSDASDSSFQRSRRPTSSAGFGFRSSMRQAPAARNEASPAPPKELSTKGSSRWSLRSLSPPATFRRNSSSVSLTNTQAGMRQSLRNSDDGGAAKRNSLQLSFGRGAKSTPQKKSAKASRFAGSSDEEDEVATTGFTSRFNDSSDEDERPGSSSQGSALSRGSLRGKSRSNNTFRGTAPVIEEPEDSADLPDSDNEKVTPATRNAPPVAPLVAQRPGVLSRTTSDNIGTNSLRRSGSGRGAFATTVTANGASPPRERRGSFMGSILRRNKRPDQASKIQRAEVTESAARRDTRLERDTEALKELRTEQRPTSPRLQRKLFGKKREESFPISEEPEPTTNDKMEEVNAAASPTQQRPMSSNGKLVKNGAANQRPNYVSRRSTSLGLPGISETNGNTNGSTTVKSRAPHLAYDQESLAAVSEAGGHKKKKFGSLRRMFGLSG